MFGVLCKRVSVRTSSSVVELLFSQNPSISVLSPLRYISTDEYTNDERSFTVSYLVNSCGLSPESALLASKQVHFETLTQPDSVLALLKNRGFSKTLISKLVNKWPKLLLCSPEETLLPKLEFFQSRGFSCSDIGNILLSRPFLLHRSLENQIVPAYNLLKDLLKSDKRTIAAIKKCYFFPDQNFENCISSKINILRDGGVSRSNIVRMLRHQTGLFTMSVDKFTEAVEKARNLGFDPSKRLFVQAVASLMSMTKSTWEKKVDTYKRWNLSEVEILAAFRKEPYFMTKSEDKVMSVMDIFVNQLGWESSIVARHPYIMKLSLEKRLVPRASVLQFLVSKGLIVKKFRSTMIFEYPETTFLKRFVNCYDKAPEILKLYNEKLAPSR